MGKEVERGDSGWDSPEKMDACIKIFIELSNSIKIEERALKSNNVLNGMSTFTTPFHDALLD